LQPGFLASAYSNAVPEGSTEIELPATCRLVSATTPDGYADTNEANNTKGVDILVSAPEDCLSLLDRHVYSSLVVVLVRLVDLIAVVDIDVDMVRARLRQRAVRELENVVTCGQRVRDLVLVDLAG